MFTGFAEMRALDVEPCWTRRVALESSGRKTLDVHSLVEQPDERASDQVTLLR
jgi:hypothetical protein